MFDAALWGIPGVSLGGKCLLELSKKLSHTAARLTLLIKRRPIKKYSLDERLTRE